MVEGVGGVPGREHDPLEELTEGLCGLGSRQVMQEETPGLGRWQHCSQQPKGETTRVSISR